MQNNYCLGVIVARQTRDSFNQIQLDAVAKTLIDGYKNLPNLSVFTSGCDSGIPFALKSYCVGQQIHFLEVRIVMEGTLDRRDLNRVWMARNGSILELSQKLLIVTTVGRKSELAEDAVRRAQQARKPYSLYVPSNGYLEEIEYER